MTCEEKKKELYELCTRQPSCTNCPLNCTDHTCWSWQKEDAKECDINTAHNIAFPPSPAPQIKDSGERREFATGAVRDIQEGKGRCDLMPLDVVANYLSNETIRLIAEFQRTSDIEWLYLVLGSMEYSEPYTVTLEVAKHFEAGAKKYGEYNWQKGIPTHCYIDSAVRHYLKWMRGDNDEPHDRAFVWNILCCIWTCIHKPELNDYPFVQNNNMQGE